MESIVSPWIIYLFGIIKPLNFTITLFMLLSFICAIGCLIFGYADAHEEKLTSTEIGARKKIKSFFVMGLIFMMFFIFTPDKDTVLGMYVSNEITYDRAEKAVDIAKDIKKSLKQDVIDIIQEVTKEKDEN